MSCVKEEAMHRRQLNSAEIQLTIEPTGPVLIKTGMEGADPTLPDMNFVRTNGQIYLPGSSLKGVIRSYCEKILRTVRPGEDRICCNIFDDKSSCGKRMEKKESSPKIYRDSCLACKLFGSTALASHIWIKDFYPLDEVKTEERTNVAICRILGSVAAGPFDMEVLINGKFHGQLYLRNFELWQLGLLGLCLRDMAEGRVRIGFAKSRGLGEVRITVDRILIRYHGREIKENKMVRLGQQDSKLEINCDGHTMVYGVGRLANEEEIKDYDYSPADETSVEGLVKPFQDLTEVVYSLEGHQDAMALFRACVNNNWKEKILKG
jgi:CRISPR-associated RAMP protein (TIGR02581 family)